MADEAGVALVVSLPRLYHGYTRAISKQLDEGRLGEPTYCRIRLSHDGAIAGWLPDRFYDPTAAVGGALSDLGCHPVYLTQLFLGARPGHGERNYASFTSRQVEDQAVVTLGYPVARSVSSNQDSSAATRSPSRCTAPRPAWRTKHRKPAPDTERRSRHMAATADSSRRC